MLKHLIHKTSYTTSKINQNHIRLGFIILTLLCFVLGAGAPASDGGH